MGKAVKRQVEYVSDVPPSIALGDLTIEELDEIIEKLEANPPKSWEEAEIQGRKDPRELLSSLR